jgi:hypothetical protein
MPWLTKPKTTKHTCNGGNGPAFGRKTAGCPRCDELLAGAAPVEWKKPATSYGGYPCATPGGSCGAMRTHGVCTCGT